MTVMKICNGQNSKFSCLEHEMQTKFSSVRLIGRLVANSLIYIHNFSPNFWIFNLTSNNGIGDVVADDHDLLFEGHIF